MPYPQEYQIATLTFKEFLTDVKAASGLATSNMAYTMAQGVLQAFRRRLNHEEAIRFSNILPAGLRALFVADWDVTEEQVPFETRAIMNAEVGDL